MNSTCSELHKIKKGTYSMNLKLPCINISTVIKDAHLFTRCLLVIHQDQVCVKKSCYPLWIML